MIIGVYSDREKVRYFNKDFYYKYHEEGKCTVECYNDRLKAHLSEEEIKKNAMLLDWNELHSQYQSYRLWNPVNKLEKKMTESWIEDKVRQAENPEKAHEEIQEDLFQKLERNSKKFKTNKFDFY